MLPSTVARYRPIWRTFVVSFTVSAMLATFIPIAMAAGTFVDDDGSVHEADIEWIADKEITKGCNPPNNNRYCPNDGVTRGQMAAYLVRAQNMTSGPSAGFIDTSRSVFRADIDSIAHTGVTKGCNPPTNDRYCPDDVVTRGQMAAFLKRTFNLDTPNVDYFLDDGGTTFEDDINAVAAVGISVGCGSGRFCPDSEVTREQMASFIKRAMAGGLTPPTPPQPSPTNPTPPPTDLPEPGASKPPGAVIVEPEDDLAAMVKSRPRNTTFYLTKGIHRLQGVEPKDGDEFVGARGAVMSGARVLTGFQKDGSHWVVTGQTQQNERDGSASMRCEDGYSGCLYPEQIFIDNVELWQVTSRSQLKSGTWYFDYEADRIYIADNPKGHLVETSVIPHAFVGSAKNVTIRDLIIEKYASPANMGVIHGRDGRTGPQNHAWKVIGNEIRLSASNGVHFGDSMVVKDNYIHNNGRLGIGSAGSNKAVALHNEISYNCRITGFACFGYGGGGIKLADTTGAVMQANYVHHNTGHGLHDDEGTRGSLYDGNLVVANAGHGIMVEISFDSTVRNNTVRKNGFEPPEGRGSGIRVNSSRNVVVSGNLVTDNAAGIVGWEANRSPYLHDLTVTGNTVINSTGYNGLRTSGGSVDFDSRSITWNNNTYDINGVAKPFHLNSQRLNPPGWRGEGYDNSSSFK